MKYHITMSREFWSDLRDLPPNVVRTALRVIDEFASDPWSTHHHPEKIQNAEPGIHSSRINQKYRIIWKHIKPNDVVLCLVDNHDEAYRRAQRKSFTLERGMVRIADVAPAQMQEPAPTPGMFKRLFSWRKAPGELFMGYTDDELEKLGVPKEIVPLVRQVSDLNELEYIEHQFPESTFDQLLDLVIEPGTRVTVPDSKLRKSLVKYQGGSDLYRFLDEDEFQRVLHGSMEEWMLFLAPDQRQLVTRRYAGPARVKGVAGSGKSVVAIHRTRNLAREAVEQNRKVLFLTFGNRLPNVMMHLLKKLAGDGAPELAAVDCRTIHSWCYGLLQQHGMTPKIDRNQTRQILREAINTVQEIYPDLSMWKRPESYFADEIKYIIKGRAVGSKEEYLALRRSGRGVGMRERERTAVYEIYEVYQKKMEWAHLWDFDDYILKSLDILKNRQVTFPYQSIVVDEIQDLTEATMKLIRAMIAPGENDLFLVGDGLQQIYPGGYSLGSLGIDIVGRGTVLRANYRNTQEVLQAAHAMMEGSSFNDLEDSESEVEIPEFSKRRGPVPQLRCFRSPGHEIDWICDTIQRLKQEEGYKNRDFAILYRWRKPYQTLINDVLAQSLKSTELKNSADSYFGAGVKHSTFDSAKGLEFKVLFVVGVDDRRLRPFNFAQLEADEREDAMAREKRRLYVALTRARDRLFLSHSEGDLTSFLKDIPATLIERVT